MAASYAPGLLFDSMKHPAETDEFIKIIKAERGVEDDVGAQRLFGEYAFDKGNTDDAKTHLKKAYKLDGNHYHTAELLRALGEDVELPEQLEEADEDYESIVGESLNDEESVGKTLGQIALTALICGGLAFGYYYKAKRDFRASELAVEAKPMVTAETEVASKVRSRITRRSSTKSLRHPRRSQGWHSRTPCFGLSTASLSTSHRHSVILLKHASRTSRMLTATQPTSLSTPKRV